MNAHVPFFQAVKLQTLTCRYQFSRETCDQSKEGSDVIRYIGSQQEQSMDVSKEILSARFEVLTVMKKTEVYWDVTACKLITSY
jgi:hypothetical protein